MRSRLAWSCVGSAALLAGCAAFDTLSVDVSSTGDWPAGRQTGSYAFERLPSQQARADETQVLETAAQSALLKAGFTAAAPGQVPGVLVQVGARDRLVSIQVWDDPLWWRGGYGYWRHGPWVSPYWGLSIAYPVSRYEREVAVLICDRASGQPLFEARASSEGAISVRQSTSATMVMPACFRSNAASHAESQAV